MSTLAEPRIDARAPYGRFSVPVALVTTWRGRELYGDSYRLFDRLAEVAASQSPDRVILAIWQGAEHVEDSGVEALETLLRTSGLRLFFRASAHRAGPERVARTKWNWEFLGEYLGWEWSRR